MNKNYTSVGKIAQLNIRITLTIGILSLIFATLMIASYLCNWVEKETLKFIVSTVATAGGITSAFYVAENLKTTKTDKKVDRSISFISTWISPTITIPRESFSKIRVATKQNPSISDHPKIIKDLIEQDDKLLQDTTTILNFLEEIAMCIKYDLADEETLRNYFQLIVTRIYQTFELWIKEERLQRGNDLFLDLEQLYNKWRSQ